MKLWMREHLLGTFKWFPAARSDCLYMFVFRLPRVMPSIPTLPLGSNLASLSVAGARMSQDSFTEARNNIWLLPKRSSKSGFAVDCLNAETLFFQERGGNNSFTHEALTLKYKLDNQFELVFVVGFQKILTLTYVDKLIDDVHRLFRDKYRTEIQQQSALSLLNGTFDFQNDFLRLLREAEEGSKIRAPTTMKKFEDSEKAKKPARSMIETRGEKTKEKTKNNKKKGAKKEGSDGPLATSKIAPAEKSGVPVGPENGELSKEELIRRKREEFIQKHGKGLDKSNKSTKSDIPKEKGKKAPRVWELGGCANKEVLDYSTPTTNGTPEAALSEDINLIRGTGPGGQLQDLDCSSSDDEGATQNTKPSATKGTLGGMFGMLKGLVGSKSLSREDMESVLDKMRDHLIAKNVAADIAVQLCESVANKLEGKVMGTFSTVTSTVKQALQESLVQILQPQRRVDMLRDIMDAQRRQRPYVVTFCGVNGVGKSTNLAKISFWLLENGFSVLIAACDTFRAGAVEQLRTHTRRLTALHPPEKHGGRTMVQLFEKGYGKDAAGIAMEAIAFGSVGTKRAYGVILYSLGICRLRLTREGRISYWYG